MNKREWRQSVLLTLLGLILTAGLITCLVWLASFFSRPISIYILVLSAGGGFGGLCYSLIENKGYLKLCSVHQYEEKEDKPAVKDKKTGLDLGCIADILIGIGSAFAIFLVLSGLVKLTNDIKTIELGTIFMLASLGIVAGAGGKYIFPMLVQKMEDMLKAQQKAEEADKKASNVKEEAETNHQESLKQLDNALVAVGNALPDTYLEQAESTFNHALKANPQSAEAKVGLAMVRKRQDKLTDAIRFCTEAITTDPNCAVAYYNRACYRSLSKQPIKEILDDLEKAIKLDKSLSEHAEKDKDFKSIKARKEFLEIISTSK